MALEFKALRETIHALKMSNQHFVHLFESYEVIDEAIVQIENGLEPNTDGHLEIQKKKRLLVKDELSMMLINNPQ